MNCGQCKEILVEYIEGLLADSRKGEIEKHLESCPPCRAEVEQLTGLQERLVGNGNALAESDFEDEVLSRIFREQSLRLRQVSKTDRHIKLWRNIMRSKVTKFAAAALIILVAALSITFLEKSATVAYALPHTIEANHSVRYIHIRDFKAGEDEPKEFWVECDGLGQVKNARMHFPDWASAGDGAKVVVWKQNKAQVYFKRKNSMVVVADKTVAERMLKLVEECDPRLAVEHIYEQETQGEVQIEIDEPSDKGDLITVTATYLPESATPEKRLILFVDQATRLVTSIESYQLKGDEYEETGVMEFFDYNQAIEAEMFVLDDEVPADAMRIDQTTQEIGLLQGDLNDEEIALEVVRQFFEALIAQDYGKAGRLMEGMPADKMREGLGHIRFLRIVSVGPVGPHPKPQTRGVVVLCTVEIEKNGKISEWKLKRLGVRQVYGKPGRWTIFGGI